MALAALSLLAPLLIIPSASAAPSLDDIRTKVRLLEEDATAAAEGAQEAKVKLAGLTRTLDGIQQASAVQSASVNALSKTLSSIAIEQYKSGGLSQSLELLFSADPSLYLDAAGSLNSITRKQSTQLRKFQAAKQRLDATSLTVNDKLAIVKRTQARLAQQSAQAQAKLDQAEKLLSKLTKAERERLAKLSQDEEDADEAASRAAAKAAGNFSGRGGLAIKYALKQIGDRYVFGAAGMTTWDCSGLTMRAFNTAGVSLPHSSRAQSRMGKGISFGAKKPGDLMFFGSPVSHVGIYLGGGRMVHAPRSGSRVKVATTDMGKKRLVAIRRF